MVFVIWCVFNFAIDNLCLGCGYSVERGESRVCIITCTGLLQRTFPMLLRRHVLATKIWLNIIYIYESYFSYNLHCLRLLNLTVLFESPPFPFPFTLTLGMYRENIKACAQYHLPTKLPLKLRTKMQPMRKKASNLSATQSLCFVSKKVTNDHF